MPRPQADFSDIFTDPNINDDFRVLRRADIIISHGRSTPTVIGIYDTWGVVTVAGANDLQRLPAQQYQRKTIAIDTPFDLQGPKPGQQPDVVRYNGDDYVVVDIQDYSRFGSGFVNALASRLDARVEIPSPLISE